MRLGTRLEIYTSTLPSENSEWELRRSRGDDGTPIKAGEGFAHKAGMPSDRLDLGFHLDRASKLRLSSLEPNTVIGDRAAADSDESQAGPARWGVSWAIELVSIDERGGRRVDEAAGTARLRGASLATPRVRG